MNLEQQTRDNLSLLLDKANSLAVEPHFLDVLVCEFANRNHVTEDAFLVSYFLRLARALMAESVTALKSDHPALVGCARLALQELSAEELEELDLADYKILRWNLNTIDSSGKIRHTHVEALTIAREDIEAQKAKYGKQDFTTLVNEIFLPHIEPLVPQQKQRLTELTTRMMKALSRQKTERRRNG